MPSCSLCAAARRRPLIWVCMLAVAAFAVAGCGKTSSDPSSTSGSGGSTSTIAAASVSTSSGCGAVPTLAVHDQSGVLAGLAPTYASQYNGYATPIFKSAWANFKPKGKPPYTIGLAFTQPINSFQAAMIPMLEKELRAVNGVGNVILLSAPPTGLTTELQQANSLIQQHVAVLVIEPIVPQAFIPIAARAAQAGIPTISVLTSTPTPTSINIAPNSVADGAESGARLAQLIGGKGLVLGVHGIPSTNLDQQEFDGFRAAFAKCTGIKLDDSIVGAFQPAVAKQQLLNYLASHPQPIAGVVQAAAMGPGIIQAFQQAGRPLPAMIDVGSTVGDLAFWNAHQDKLAAALTITPNGIAQAGAYTVSQLLSGHGPKVSELSAPSLQIASSHLSQLVKRGTSVNDEAAVQAPWLPISYLAPLFNK